METNNTEDDNESHAMLNKIKMEPELIIESDDYEWQPVKLEDEQNDYYQEYCQEFKEQDDIKNESAHEQYTIKYLDEYKDYDDDDDEELEEDDLYEPSEEVDDDDASDNEVNLDIEYNDCNMDTEYNIQLELYAGNMDNKDNKVLKESVESLRLCKYPLNYWLFKTYAQRTCPECNEQFAAIRELQRHIERQHADCVEEAQNNYYCNTCKKCQREYHGNFTRYKHSVRHRENGEELLSNKCKICNLKLTKSIHKHFVEEHAEVVDEFVKSANVKKPIKCPICHYTYANNEDSKLWHHFVAKHPQESQEKFHYNCHLCEHEHYAEEEMYLQHLMVEHDINTWQVLNFRKLFEDKEYLACLKCHRVYLKNDTGTLLKHYLEHDSLACWTCRFCSKRNFYKHAGHSWHMCPNMLNYYNRRHSKVSDETNRDNKIKTLQEFQEYIAHVCPFCKEEFNELLKWQEHLRNIHAINTLKGLEMKVVATTDNNKLRCVICHTMVANTPVQLHAHRFQHLPFKPYKCRHCKQTPATFKMAVNHAVKRCKDEQDRDYINQVLISNKIDSSTVEIQCAFCNYRKFSNAKEVFTHYQDEHNNFEEFFTPDDGSIDNFTPDDGSIDNLLSCIVCHKKFQVHDHHVRLLHVQKHFDENTFKCPLCRFSHVRSKPCIRHIKNVHYAKPLEVLETLKRTQTIVNKKSSKVSEPHHHQSTAVQTQLAKPKLSSHVLNEFIDFISFACPECNEGMSSQEDWQTHITTQHDFFDESNVSIKDSTTGSLICPICKLNLPTCLIPRQIHKLTHMPYRSFICNLCYAHFNTLGVLYGHFRRKHFAKGSFKCAICPEVLATSHQRTEHLKQTHPSDEWPKHMCLICYQVLESRSSLNRHMIIHDAERVKHTCDVCDAKLFGRKALNDHMARHKERGEIKEKNADDIPSKSSGFVEAKLNVMVEVKEGRKTDLDSGGVDVKSKKANLNNKRRKSLKNQPCDMKEKTDLDNFGVNVKPKKAMPSNNKRKSVPNDTNLMEQETDMDNAALKSKKANLSNNKPKTLRNSIKK